MGGKIGPSSPELAAFYSARSAWRSRGEERMRFRKASALARVPPGAAVLDIGCRDGGLRAFLPPGVRYQGLDIAPEFAAPDILIQDISGRLPVPDRAVDYVWPLGKGRRPAPWVPRGVQKGRRNGAASGGGGEPPRLRVRPPRSSQWTPAAR